MRSQESTQLGTLAPDAEIIRFDHYQVDVRSGELRKDGRKIRLQPQPFQLLVLLLRNAGRIVSREDLRRELWTEDTFVDFDHRLAAAMNKMRESLDDSAEKPRYIETLPKRGYRFIGTIEREKLQVVALEEAAEPVAVSSHSVETNAGASYAAKPILALRLIVGVGLAIAVLSTLAFRIVRNRMGPETVRSSTAFPFTSLPGLAVAPRFSPDGSRIAFSWSPHTDPASPGLNLYDLYVKTLGGEEKLQLTHHPSEWICAAWSPDGTQIAFHRKAGKDSGIYIVSAMGGPERRLIATHIDFGVGAPISWSQDGKWIAFGDSVPDEPPYGLYRISVETSEVIPFERDPDCTGEANPEFSHDDRRIFYACVHTMYEGELRSRPVGGGAPTVIARTSSPPVGLAVSGDDQRVAYSNAYGWSGIFFVNVKDGSINRVSVPDDSSWPTISTKGDKLAFSTQVGNGSIWRRDLLHPNASPVNLIPSSREQNSAQYSPDAKHIAFESKRSGDWGLWVSDADGRNLLKVSKDIVGSGSPRWSPDGSKIAFDTAALDPSSVYVVDVAEAMPRKLQTQIADMKLPAWSRDGKWIYFVSDSHKGHSIYRCSAEGGAAKELSTGVVFATRPEESNDGEYLFFTSREVDSQLEKLSLKDMKRGIQAEPMPHVMQWTLWQNTPKGIYFVPNQAPRTMRYFEFATHKSKDVFTLRKDFDDGISVSQDGRYILYSQADELNADVMVMDKYH
jgi:Tol biopolymer transport system component/DNA-binding winged helix-turn-helix (wHTH) protein